MPAAYRVKVKEDEKLHTYLDLTRALKKMWNWKGILILIAVGAFGTVPKTRKRDLINRRIKEEMKLSRPQL